MSAGDTYVNYALLDDIRKAFSARVIDDMGVDSEEEDRHVSELERRMAALDEKETYIAVKTLIATHRDTFKKAVKYIKEGE